MEDDFASQVERFVISSVAFAVPSGLAFPDTFLGCVECRCAKGFAFALVPVTSLN